VIINIHIGKYVLISMEEDNLTKVYIKDRVLFAPMYKISVALFLLAVVLFPISIKWSTFFIFSVLAIWSMIPGFINPFFIRLIMNDVFAYIIAVNYGLGMSSLYIFLTLLFKLYFGPKSNPLNAVRDSIGLYFGAVAVAFIPYFQANIVIGYYLFMVIDYVVYYALVVFVSANEIPREMALLPGCIFFDFIFTGSLLKYLEGPILSLLEGNLYSVWPFLLIIAIVLISIKVAQKIFFKKKTMIVIESLYKTPSVY